MLERTMNTVNHAQHRNSKAARILSAVMLMLSLPGLTGCAPTTILCGNRVERLQKNESAPFSGWLMQDEAMAKLLERAEACAPKK